METAALKSFAAWARTALIGEVSARIGVVLGSGSAERVEQSGVVAALEQAVAGAGGGDVGRAAVVDKVAYTWFNRIVALRFMDANGYTGIGVVSPAAGGGGQPEVLADAKRGNFDGTVLSRGRVVESVTGLLNGTRRSDVPQGEAYGLLLAEYCRFWNRSMPFMFEREGDYTELLMPANLLADDSVRARAVAVLTDEVCRDVEVIGWLYQFYIAERKDEVFAGFKKNRKAGAAEIPAATQLFTPHWIVRYLVENSLGRLWLLNRPNSKLAEQMDFYIAPVDEETDFLRVAGPEELKIIDPACGSGHMLTYAFDLLYAIYEEEGYAPADIPGLILTNNLYGTEIDPRAGALAAFALAMKARARQRTFFNRLVEPNVCVLEPISFTPDELDQLCTPDGNRDEEETFWNQFQHADVLGSLVRPQEDLIQPLTHRINALPSDEGDLIRNDLFERGRNVLLYADFLSSRYHVVVANPPYMGSKNMSAVLSSRLKTHYPNGKSDLFASFILRNLELALPNGQLGFMTPFVWMFIASYEQLRRSIVGEQTITSLVQLEYSGFDGATVPICTFTLEKAHHGEFLGGFIRLTDFKGSASQEPRTLEAVANPDCGWFFRASTTEFARIPGSPIAYWVGPAFSNMFAAMPKIDDIAELKNGLQTGDVGRFVRELWEVDLKKVGKLESRKNWVFMTRAGSLRKWHQPLDAVVWWKDDGHDVKSSPSARPQNDAYYGRMGLTWGMITSGGSSFRIMRDGSIFENSSPALFTDDILYSLGLLNSKVAAFITSVLNPTLNMTTGDIRRMPISPDVECNRGTASAAARCVAISRTEDQWIETTADFERTALLLSNLAGFRLAERYEDVRSRATEMTLEMKQLEEDTNQVLIDAYGLTEQLAPVISIHEVTLSCNPHYRYRGDRTVQELETLFRADTARDLISYAVGCMFGRFSLDESGLVLASQGETLEDYLVRVPEPSFVPDVDNVIPVVDGEWFEDDIVTLFRQFLRVAFGEEHFEENLRFVAESLGVKDLRDYFVKSFYKDHVQRYKKRPIYWLFSSPKGSFNALIYMHRYTPSTVSTVLNEYLREFVAKLEASREHHERLAAGDGNAREKGAAQKEVDRLRKVLLELEEYEHDVLYPLATQQIEIDLDDGVKANYPKFGAALKKVTGLEVKQ